MRHNDARTGTQCMYRVVLRRFEGKPCVHVLDGLLGEDADHKLLNESWDVPGTMH